MSTMRTGIAVFVLPLSVLSLLIATSKYYDIIHVMHLLVPLLGLCLWHWSSWVDISSSARS